MKRNWGGMFELYHDNNPQVYELFVRFARELLDAGHMRGGAKMIFERIRWEASLSTAREQGLPKWKLNNNYASYYARKLAADDARFRSFFQFREAGNETQVTL